MTRLLDAILRIMAVFVKEFIQMRRDRMTFAMMLVVPIMQLMLFGYAININPRHLPVAIIAEEQTPVVRTLVNALRVSGYYDLILKENDPRQTGSLLARGDVSFVIIIPAGFTEKLLRGQNPQLLIEADATDPAASSGAVAQAQAIVTRALRHDLTGPLARVAPVPAPVDVVVHPRYNPEAITQYNIVPGLLGVIITMTLVMITGMAMTREAEQGTMENLLAMPVRPLEVMIGKVMPYIGVGAIQTAIVLTVAHYLFGVPFAGDMAVLLGGVALFILANLAVGFTFSTIARSQLQAMQLTFFFFLPSLLLSGFMFPFRGMPGWAQTIGEILPLTHFLRIVRGVMLKGGGMDETGRDFLAMLAFTLVVALVAMLRYRRTLD